MPPQKIGRYEIESELGRGGMATVYRAHDPSFDREVALKVLPREMLHDPQFHARFEREFKIVASLEHPAIVPVYDVGEEDGQPFFVMRYMPGGSLSEWLKKDRFSLKDTARIVERLALGLAYAHKKGIVHRDLKPGNILFDSNGDPFISDFGVAKLTESAANITGSAVVGTPAYMSPEQAQSGKVDRRSDVYCMGAIIYEMLTGKQPYEADTPMGIVVKHITQPVPEIRDVDPDIPPEVDAIIKTAMAKDPDKRYATMTDLARALTLAAFGESGAMTAEAASRQSPRGVRSNNTLALIIGGVVLVVILLGAFLFRNRLPFPTASAPATPSSGPATIAPPVAPPIQPTSTRASPTPLGASLVPSSAPSPTSTSAPVPTPTLAATSTPSSPVALPVEGAADQIALISDNAIWLMNVDGTGAHPITHDSAAKTSLEWLPDRQNLTYVSGPCAYELDAQSLQAQQLLCLSGIKSFDSFRVSPSGQRLALSIDQELFIIPFNFEALKKIASRSDLVSVQGSCSYSRSPVRDFRWSKDNNKLAIVFGAFPGSKYQEAIRVLDVSNCTAGVPPTLDEFPSGKFDLAGYDVNPIIPSFDWDGNERFLLNDAVRNGGFGNLYLYDSSTQQGKKINPVDGTCCYRDARWSPDGSYLIFLFQDIRQGQQSVNQLYYVPLADIGSGGLGTPLKLPSQILTNPRENPEPALRAAP